MINFLRIIGNIKVGDYLHQNGTIDNIPSSDIIGVCVISNGTLPDGYARFISLTQEIYYYQRERRIRLKSEYKKDLPGRKGEAFSWGYINEKNGDPLLINPYLPDSSFNPEFLKDLHKHRGNAFQDYKGYENMKIYKKKYRNKKFSNVFREVIENSPSYKKENWYLPAIGELTFLPARFEFIRDKINEALLADSVGVSLTTNYYWSSTEWGPDRAWGVSMNGGCVYSKNKIISNNVRYFLSL